MTPVTTVLASPAVDDPLDRSLACDDLWTVYCTVAAQVADDAAILAPGRPPLSFAGFADRIAATKAALNALGVGRGDRLAVALPNGPDTAVLFLAATACATHVGLNPAATAAELRVALARVRPKALVVAADADAARAVAAEQGIPCLTLVPDMAAPAGTFALAGAAVAGGAADTAWNGRDDVGMILLTSGSTAQPKLVPRRVSELQETSRQMRDWFGLVPGDRSLHMMPMFHGHGLCSTLFNPITAATGVVFLPSFDLDLFFDGLVRYRPTWYSAGYTVHAAVLQRAAQYPEAVRQARLRFIRSGSGRLDPAVMRGLEAAFGTPVIERYGQSETNTVTANPLPPRARKPGTVGVPYLNEIAILGDGGVFLPPGRDGEVLVRGPSVFLGYLDDPDGNAATFHDGWFRTGDLGRTDDDGFLTITGRIKDTINRGGEKISPTEVEDALASHPGVAAACVFGVPHPTLGEDVGAVVVLAPGAAATTDEIAATARTAVGDFKVPRRIDIAAALPRTASGKIDRLAARDGYLAAAARADAAPRGATLPDDDVLGGLWRDALDRDSIGADDDFFLSGGDSLAAANLLVQVRRAFGVALPMAAVFRDASTPARMAAAIAAARGGAAPAPLEAVPPAGDGPLPLSYAQEQLWFHARMHPGSTAYVISRAVRLRGRLDVAALQRALATLTARHAALRTTFEEVEGVPWQVVHPSLDLPLSPVPCSTDDPDTAAARIADAEIRRPFDLVHGPLVRAGLWRFGADDHLFVLTLHHINVDGGAMETISRELAALYAAFAAGRAPALPLPARQFADYAAWERRRHGTPAEEVDLDYWRRRLDGAPPEISLPPTAVPGRPRPANARVRASLPGAVVAALRRLARAEGTTLHAGLLAGLNALLHRYGCGDDIVVGSPFSQRRRPELAGVVGMMINILPIRTDLSGDPTFRALLRRVGATVLEAMEHQDAPFLRIVERSGAPRQAGRHPLFQVSLVLSGPATFALALPGLDAAEVLSDDGSTSFDLNLVAHPQGDDFALTLRYDTARFDAGTIERLLRHFATLLDGAVADPDCAVSALPLLDAAERRLLLEDWSGAARGAPVRGTIAELFADQVRARPDAPAVRCGDTVLSYAALDRWSDRLARRLAGAGVGAETVVGLLAPRAPAQIAALLGIVKAGGAYLALDPDHPADRHRLIVADAGARLVLVAPGLAEDGLGVPAMTLDADDRGDAGPSAEPPPPARPGPDGLAYVTYTSGSTGRPKGIAIAHRGVVRLVRGADYARFAPDERFLQLAPLAFDASTFEVWGALLNGGCIVQVPQAHPGLRDIARTIVEHDVSTAWLTAGLFHQMVDHEAGCFARVGQILAGGDVLSPAHVRRFRAAAPGCRLINGYGPTENTTFTCTWTVADDDALEPSVPIGRPIAGTRVYVLGPGGALTPPGMPGELHIGGDGLARGYVGAADATSARFVPDPFDPTPGARLYCSGDRVRWRDDGTLEFLGRLDGQVKIRGHRVEPAEVEATLLAHPAVRGAAVAAVRDGDGAASLVACIVADDDDCMIGDFLRRRLPPPMVPALRRVAALPTTAAGKVDRAAVAALARAAAPRRAAYVAPRTPVEAIVADIWTELLAVERIGVGDNFFDLGGHSLLAMKLAFRLWQELAVELPLRAVFEAPTVESLALAAVAAMAGDDAAATAQ